MMETRANGTGRIASVMEVGVVVLLTTMVNTFVVVQAVEGAEDLVAEIADSIVKRLQVLLLLVALESEFGA